MDDQQLKNMNAKITPCLWFDHQAEEAARFYTGIFKNSKITQISRYPKNGQEIHGQAEGSVLTVAFELDGQPFTALNGGPIFKFNEAVSFQVFCETQEELDSFWARLSEGGDPEAQQCGWIKDKYGVSWQIVPAILPQLVADPDRARVERTFQALLGMKKLDIAALKRAHSGQ
jgi:predicted 3-demethylubiquinone-9 3-methyltransferase (glyoxalase superfamily)